MTYIIAYVKTQKIRFIIHYVKPTAQLLFDFRKVDQHAGGKWLIHDTSSPLLHHFCCMHYHYDDVIMSAIASQITSLTIVYSIVYSDADKRKHQSSASLAFVWGIHRDRWIPRTKGQLRRKSFHLMTSSCIITSALLCDQLNSSTLDKRPPFRKRCFLMHFREWKILYFEKNITEVCC